MERSSGVLLAMSSLPSKHGIGTMGKCAYEFVDFLNAAGQRYWQLLPLGPTSYGDSPYSSFSSFAGNPYYIDLDTLVDDGMLTEDELKLYSTEDEASCVNYSALYETRAKLLRLAFKRGREAFKDEIAIFREENKSWLEDYALFMAIKSYFGMLSLPDWPDKAIAKRESEAMAKYSQLLHDDVEFYAFTQYLFFEQWSALRKYAASKNISFIGDIPIYVALDSADLWSEPEFFMLDENNMPKEIAGVPPDDYNDEGQLWGNPLYNWEAMEKDGFGWWIRRIDGARKLYDLIRIDHFRGFDSFWAVPVGEKTAINGVWRKGPGRKLVDILTSWFHGLGFIAEDLGYPTPSVKKLLADSGFPGMKVLEFAFDAELDSDYLPHNCIENSVCYLGTHDNNTVLGWLEDISEEDKAFASAYMHVTDSEGWCKALIRTGMATASKLFIVQMQDLLELDGSCRMNTPGKPFGNWQWRMLPGSLCDELSDRLLHYTKTYRRCK